MVRRKMEALSTDELQRLVTEDAASCEPGALAIARHELALREALERQFRERAAAEADELTRIPLELFQPQRRLTRTLLALAGICVLTSALMIGSYAIARSQFTGIHGTGTLVDQVLHAEGLALLAASLMAIIVFCVWVRAMYENLPSLGGKRARFTSADAVLWFFIPVANLVRGFAVMKVLWVDSQPQFARVLGPKPRRSAPLVGWWWASVLASLVLGAMVGGARAMSDGGAWAQSKERLDRAWVQSTYDSSILLGSVVVVGILFMAVVRGVARRQQDQHDDLLRRQPVPPPVDRLR